MKSNEKTHYRKAFNSPYLSSADIVEPTVLTISHVVLKGDETKKTKDQFNTAYFVEKELRKGEKLKPMILNAVNSKTMKELTGSHFLEDWQNIRVMVFVDHNVRFGRETVEGLRISNKKPSAKKRSLTPKDKVNWDNAKKAYIRDGNLHEITKRVEITKPHMDQLISEAEAEANE